MLPTPYEDDDHPQLFFDVIYNTCTVLSIFTLLRYDKKRNYILDKENSALIIYFLNVMYFALPVRRCGDSNYTEFVLLY